MVVALGLGVAGWGVFRKRNWKSLLGLLTASAFAALLFGYVFVLVLLRRLAPASRAPSRAAEMPPRE